MTKYAVLDKDNLVINTIIADSIEIANEATGLICVEYTDDVNFGIGWTYNQETNIFTEPVA